MDDRRLLAVLTDAMVVGGVTWDEAKVFLRVDESASVAVQNSRDAAFTAPLTTDAITTNAASDFTAILSLSSLESETTYYYRAVIDGAPLNDGVIRSFTTFASPGASTEFSFAITADSINARSHPTVGADAYEAIVADDMAFLMQLGDFDHRNPQTLEAMRLMHRQVRSDLTQSGADFAEFIAPNLPIVHIWDDHDYGENNADKNSSNKPSALQAFDENYPTYERPNAAGIWHSFQYGPAEFFMLDVRSQRDPAIDPDGPDKSMLDGDKISNGQLNWLKGELLNSTATWKFIASGVTFNPTTKPADAWGAYSHERQDLVDFIDDNSITGVVFLSGDLHSGGAIDDGTNADFPELSVPHTNLQTTSFASGPVGTWSEGIDSGVNGSGYASIHVSASEVILTTHAADGTVRKSLVVSAEIESTFEAAVTNFTLINADTDLPLGLLADGQTVNLAEVPTQNLNVRAHTSQYVGSVQFTLDGQVIPRSEDSSPFTLFGDSQGDYHAGSLSSGSHMLTATPFSLADATGTPGTALSISFTVIDGVPPPNLIGDYDLDGTVGQGDYEVWKQTYGWTGVGLTADANGDAVVNIADYSVWRDHVGISSRGFTSGIETEKNALDKPDLFPLLTVNDRGRSFDTPDYLQATFVSSLTSRSGGGPISDQFEARSTTSPVLMPIRFWDRVHEMSNLNSADTRDGTWIAAEVVPTIGELDLVFEVIEDDLIRWCKLSLSGVWLTCP